MIIFLKIPFFISEQQESEQNLYDECLSEGLIPPPGFTNKQKQSMIASWMDHGRDNNCINSEGHSANLNTCLNRDLIYKEFSDKCSYGDSINQNEHDIYEFSERLEPNFEAGDQFSANNLKIFHKKEKCR